MVDDEWGENEEKESSFVDAVENPMVPRPAGLSTRRFRHGAFVANAGGGDTSDRLKYSKYAEQIL